MCNIKWLVFASSVFLLVGCVTDEVEVGSISASGSTATIRVECGKGKVEIGLHNPSSNMQRQGQAVPLSTLPLASKVSVVDASTGQKIAETVADKPVVHWMSEQRRGHVEYMGLQEIELPFSLRCHNYFMQVELIDVPPETASQFVADAEFYVRRARRP